jgi:outer membrane protein assembly factor BamB
MLTAVDKTSGMVAWRKDEPVFKVGAITTSGDQIISEAANRTINLFDGVTGKLESNVTVPPPRERRFRSFYYTDGYMLVTGEDGYTLSLNQEDHSSRAPAKTGRATGKPLIAGSLAYFPTLWSPEPGEESTQKMGRTVDAARPSFEIQDQAYLVKYDMDRGAIVWKTNLEQSSENKPLLFDGAIFLGTTGDESQIYSLDAETGRIRWKHKCKAPISDAAAGHGVVYANCGDGLLALDAKSGEQLFLFRTDKYGPAGSPVPGDNLVFISGKDSNLYAVKAVKSVSAKGK